MSGAQFNLKDDWHAVGSSAAADRDATWRNNVSKALNRAYVVSGGTCEVTDNGLQIEVDAADPTSPSRKLKFWHEVDSSAGLNHPDPDTWQDCEPSRAAGRMWYMRYIYTYADNPLASGQEVPEDEVWFCQEQDCVRLVLLPGFCLYSNEGAEELTFIDENGDTQSAAVASGVLGSYTGDLQGTDPNTGNPVTVTFAAGTADGSYVGQISILNNTTGDSTLLRIDSDGLIKQ